MFMFSNFTYPTQASRSAALCFASKRLISGSSFGRSYGECPAPQVWKQSFLWHKIPGTQWHPATASWHLKSYSKTEASVRSESAQDGLQMHCSAQSASTTPF